MFKNKNKIYKKFITILKTKDNLIYFDCLLFTIYKLSKLI